MSIYTVHEPPPKANEASADPDRFVFVRDGFYFWAMLFGPLWMLWRRLWLAFFLYVLLIVGIEIGLRLAKVGGTAHVAIVALVALLVGFEAASLWRWTLQRRGWKEVAAVVGDDTESAERRFFSMWVATVPAAKPASPAMRVPRSSEPDVIGLFPEPGGSR